LSIQEALPFVNFKTHFEMMTKFSQDDLAKYGPGVGMYGLDSHKSMIYNRNTTTAGTQFSGEGLTNNRPFIFADNGDVQYGSDFLPSQPTNGKKMNANTINTSLNNRLNKYIVLGAENNNNFYGTGDTYLRNLDNLQKEFKPNVQLSADGKNCYYVDYAVIKLKDLCNAIEKMPLTKRINMKLNLFCNVGGGSIKVLGTMPPNDTTGFKLLNYDFDNTSNSFQHTCPLMVNYLWKLPTLNNNYAAGTNTFCKINYYLFIGDPKNVNIGGISCNFSDNVPTGSALKNSRLYFYQHVLRSDIASIYMEKHVEKKIVYRKYMFNQDNQIESGTSYSKLISSGIKNPIGIMIFPLIAKTNGFLNNLNVSQYTSPFDSCPATTNCLSLYNVNAVLGGQNVLMGSQIDYNFDAFMSQIASVDSVMSNHWGISNGLISQKYWEEAYKVYYIDLSRCNKSDRNVFRSLELKFVNTNIVAIDMIYIIVYDEEVTLNTQTGLWSK
jgi:hypothetical protein